MGFLTRRHTLRSAQPVDVRRTPADPLPPLTVMIPAATPLVPPSPVSTTTTTHVTQNFFYPPPPPPPPPTPSLPPAALFPPPAASFHSTVHHHYARRPERKLSFTGTAGWVLSLLACLAAIAPTARPFALWLAFAGAAAGGLGMVSSLVLGLTRPGVPLLAILTAGAAVVLGSRTAGSSSPLDQLRSALPANLPSMDGMTSSTPASAVARESVPTPRPTPTSPPQAPVPPQLEAARETAGHAMGIDYAALVARRAAAASALQQARTTMELGSPELIDANQRFMQADAALTAARQRLSSDLGVVAAERGSPR